MPDIFEQNPSTPEAAQPTAESVQEMIQDFMAQANQARTQAVQSNAEMQSASIDGVKRLLSMLESAGVNPADPQSLQAFIQKLEETEPDAAELFASALNTIFSGEQQ